MKKLSENKSLRFIGKPMLTGFLAIFPLVITIVIIAWIVNFLVTMLGPGSGFGSILQSVGLNFVENQIFAYLLGLTATLLLIYLLGVLVQAGLRKQWTSITDSIISRIPIINSIYSTSKKVASVFNAKDQPDLKSMRPVMCHFGGEGGTAVLALLTSNEIIEIDGNSFYSVLIPTSPVPIGGAILYVPIKWITILDMGIDKLINIYVSMGVSGNEYIVKKAK